MEHHTHGVFAVALALTALGSACAATVDGQLQPDGPIEDAGNPLDLGDRGPAVLGLACPTLAMPAVAGTVFVDARASGGDGSKGAPFGTLAAAFEAAGRGGIIEVAAGTYRESLTIPDKDLKVLGGFASGFGSRTDGCATILEPADPSQAVLVAGVGVTSFGLDGVTVRRGARGLLVEADGEQASALYTITSSVFANNGTTTEIGGGALLYNASLKLSRSVFRDNIAAKGAAIALGGERNATIAIEESVFDTNVGYSDHGGALYLNPSSGSIVRSTFRRNEIGRDTGYGWGGAVVVFKSSTMPSSVDFGYNVFTDNVASVGGAVFIDDGASATMSHDLLYRNRSIRENGIARGAAIYVDGLGEPGTGSRLVANHLTVANNNLGEDGQVSPSRGGDVYLETYSSATFTNSVFWNNGSESLFGDPTCSISVSYSIATSECAGTCTIGAGVFMPGAIQFVDEAANDYHEKSTAGHFRNGTFVKDEVSSPAIDKGDPAAASSREPSPNGSRANLGAFGQTGEASKSP